MQFLTSLAALLGRSLLPAFALSALAGPALADAPPPGHPTPLVLAVHPFLPAADVQKRFAPLAQLLGERLGRTVRVRVASNYEEQIRSLGTDAVDFAYMGPMPYVAVERDYGPKPLLARVVTLGRPELTGVIFVRDDSPLTSIAQLKGRRFAFGDTHSTMSTLVPHYVLLQNGVHLRDLAYYAHVQAHSNVVLGVLSGDFDAGAVRADIYDEMASRGLRALARTPAVCEHTFVARSGMPAELQQRLRTLLRELPATEEGRQAMHAVSAEWTGVTTVGESDFESARRITAALVAAQDDE